MIINTGNRNLEIGIKCILVEVDMEMNILEDMEMDMEVDTLILEVMGNNKTIVWIKANQIEADLRMMLILVKWMSKLIKIEVHMVNRKDSTHLNNIHLWFQINIVKIILEDQIALNKVDDLIVLIY